MRIAGGTLFLVFAVFLDSIEFITSAVKLDALFPGYSGVLHPVEKFRGKIQHFHNFLSCHGQPNMMHEDAILLVRYQVIIGWRWGDHILPPCSSQSDANEFIVFNRTNPISHGYWVPLSRKDFQSLGPFRRYSLVKTRDRAAILNSLPEPSTTVILRNHKKACSYANAAANEIEKRELPRLALHQTTIENINLQVEFYYSEIYKNVYNNPNQASGSGGGIR